VRSDNPILSNLATALQSSRPDNGDSTLQIPPLVFLQTEPIAPLLRLVGSGGTAEQSILSSVTVLRNNQPSSGNILVTLARGLYEIDVSLSARFNFTQVAASIHTQAEIRDPGGTSSSPLIGFFAQIGAFYAGRKFRVLLAVDGWSLRLNYNATGVAENLDANMTAVVTRLL